MNWGGESFVRFRDATNRLLKSRWHVLTLTTLAGHLTVFLVLLVSLRSLGVSAEDLSLVEAFAAWSLVRLLGSIPITPGGLGVVELGLTTALVGFGGDQADVVAAVLLYRVLTVEASVNARKSLGGTAPSNVVRAVAEARRRFLGRGKRAGR